MEIMETTVRIEGPVRVAKVESGSCPGKFHRVVIACDCEGFRFAGHCRHVALAGDELRAAARRLRRRW